MHNPADHRKKGDVGEDMAEQFLQQKGYTTVVKNYCIQGGEIDLIMHDKAHDEIVFVEVKTRYAYSRFGEVAESISSQKLSYMQRAIEKFFLSRGKNIYAEKYRMDAVFIQMNAPDGEKIIHQENAFSFDDFFDTMW